MVTVFILVAISLVVLILMGCGFALGYGLSDGKVISGIIGAVIATVIMVLFVGACVDQREAEIEYYNNGICTICGGEYEFAGGAKSRYHSEYFYTCEDCGHTIQTSEIMK